MKSGPFPSVTLALVNLTQVDGNLEARGIDLDSGHQVSLTVRYEPAEAERGIKLNGLILSLSINENPLKN